MRSNAKRYIALDVGERRIGVAVGDSEVRIASPRETVTVDGNEVSRITALIEQEGVTELVIGFPRNLNGEETAQTEYVKEFAHKLENLSVPVVFQDESLTSVLAENYLKANKKRYSKEDVDAYAAVIILNDYLEKIYATQQ
jgi:putative holliday junction resolvase